MSLSLSEVQHIANLAQLEITDDKAETLMSQLNGIFDLVNQMSDVNTEGVTPLSHPVAAYLPELALRLREDEVSEKVEREAFQAPAPLTQDGLYLVPKVVE